MKTTTTTGSSPIHRIPASFPTQGAPSVVALVVHDGLRPVLAGIAAGVLAAALSVQVLSSLLFEVDPLDPVTFAAVVALILTAALVACVVPARWAARLEAVSALRVE